MSEKPGVFVARSASLVTPQPTRPAFFSMQVGEKTLLTSFEHAREVLGDGDEAEWTRAVFMSGCGDRGIWVVPHPDRE